MTTAQIDMFGTCAQAAPQQQTATVINLKEAPSSPGKNKDLKKKTPQRLDIKVLDWRQILRNKCNEAAQNDLVFTCHPDAKITTYKSGVSSPADVKGYIAAQADIGACIMDTSRSVRALLAEYASAGGKCFIDSGAFRHFKKTLKAIKDKKPLPKPLCFDTVIERYENIITQCSAPGNLIVVAPDIVGDQEGSFQILKSYKNKILALRKLGVNIMVPLQRGNLDLAGHYERCSDLLDFEFIVGLPSNAEAVSPEEVFDFLSLYQPEDVHFLGCSERSLVHEASHKSPKTRFTCDATRLRGYIGQDRLLTQMQTQIAEDAAINSIQGIKDPTLQQSSIGDETDAIGFIDLYVRSLDGGELKAMGKALNVQPDTLLETAEEADPDAVWALIDEGNYGYGQSAFSQYYLNTLYKEESIRSRTYSIQKLAEANII